MKTFRWIIVLVAVVLCVTAWVERRARLALDQDLRRVQARRAEALAQVEQLRMAAQNAEQDEAALRVGLERVKAARASGEMPPQRKPGPIMPMDVLARDPDLQARYLATRRRTFLTAYGPLMRHLNLSAEKNAQFFALLMDFEQADQDLVMAGRIQGLSPNDPAIAKARAAAWDELRRQQATLLGPEMAEEVRQYNRTLGARSVVVPFVGTAAYAGIPLSLNQANQMAQVIAEANTKYQQGGDSDLLRVDWAAADAKLKTVLTPEQWELFQKSEPMNGGASRWMAIFNRALLDAKAAERKSSGS